MPLDSPIVVTGAAGRIGGVGRTVVELLRQRNLPVRALVRREDERATALRATGAEVVIGDLTRAADVARALAGCRRMYFGMSASAPYLEATVTAAAVAREHRDLEVFVNISQLTVSQMSLTEMTDSPQQRQHWLGEQVLNWTGLPVVHVRPTVFLQNPFFSDWAAESIANDRTIRLPWHGANLAGRCSGCGGGDRGYPGESNCSYRQGLRTNRAAVAGHARRGRGIFQCARSNHHLRRYTVSAMARPGPARPQFARPPIRTSPDHGPPPCRQPL